MAPSPIWLSPTPARDTCTRLVVPGAMRRVRRGERVSAAKRRARRALRANAVHVCHGAIDLTMASPSPEPRNVSTVSRRFTHLA